jgi:hypothetical protein
MGPATWLRTALDPALLFGAMGLRADGWQRDAMRREATRLGILASRQCGKSTTTALKAIHRAVFHPDSLVLMVAPAERQSLELLRRATECYHRIGDPVPAVRELATTLELANGSRIVALPGDPLTIRCYSGVDMVIVDEAAMVPGDGLFHAVMPMLATTGGAFWMLSTPMGKRGFYHDTYVSGDPDWTWIVARATDCPRIAPGFLEEQRRTLGERWFSQEYMCNFVDTVGAVFGEAMISSMFGDHDAPILEGF